jgi:hypothetical protein
VFASEKHRGELPSPATQSIVAPHVSDGAFDSYEETFQFTTDPLPTGKLDVEVRVTDSVGNILTRTLATVSVVNPVDQILNTTLTRAEAGDAQAPRRNTRRSRSGSVGRKNCRWHLLSPGHGGLEAGHSGRRDLRQFGGRVLFRCRCRRPAP